jgi:hypothetical protein
MALEITLCKHLVTLVMSTNIGSSHALIVKYYKIKTGVPR